MAKKQTEAVAAPVAPAAKPAKIKIPKLAKTNKHRLPRKEKKAQKKAPLTFARETLFGRGKSGSVPRDL